MHRFLHARLLSRRQREACVAWQLRRQAMRLCSLPSHALLAVPAQSTPGLQSRRWRTSWLQSCMSLLGRLSPEPSRKLFFCMRRRELQAASDLRAARALPMCATAGSYHSTLPICCQGRGKNSIGSSRPPSTRGRESCISSAWRVWLVSMDNCNNHRQTSVLDKQSLLLKHISGETPWVTPVEESCCA